MATVEQIKDRIQAILELETSIKRVKSQSIQNVGSYPVAVIFTGNATYTKDSNDTQRIDRDFRIVILVMAMAQGRELEAEEKCEEYYDLIKNLFQSRPSLTSNANTATGNTNPLSNVQQAYLTADSGFIVTEVAGGSWASIEFILRVESLYELNQGL